VVLLPSPHTQPHQQASLVYSPVLGIRIRIRGIGMFLDLPDPHPEPFVTSSVADPGCLSRILIFTHPGSRIPDPNTATKERGVVVIPFLQPQISQNFNYFIFEMLKKKIRVNFQNSQFSLSSQKYGFGIRDLENNY
jgi:hypothetical protein